ncbi:hypothetical protein [Limnoglobus roseus]|uniref:hypothetical protein n=1 Tax=Limnoglobus roseus TaxID=2598579 RepID=UPI0011EA8C4D|nr:hypothetical protein [Limnoglobus roseus]
MVPQRTPTASHVGGGSCHARPLFNTPQHRTSNFRPTATAAFFRPTPFSAASRAHVAFAHGLYRRLH